MKGKKQIIPLIQCIFVALTFFVVDFSLRFFTRWLGYYSIFELAPSLFSLCWIAIFIVALSMMPQKIGRIIYVVWYSIWSIYILIQYVYCLIFNKFFFLSDIQNASEGKQYLNYVVDVISINFFVMLVLFMAMGILGFLLFPNFSQFVNKLKRNILRCALAVCACIGMLLIPFLYTENEQALFFSSKYEYAQFTNSGFDVEISGVYH